MQEVAAMSQSVLEMTKDLVLAQIQSGSLFPKDVHAAIHHIYQSLLTLKSREESESLVPAHVTETWRAPVDWRASITRLTITCLECGAHFKQLSGHHLRLHGLNARTYRLKYGIPENQPLSAREAAAKQREMLQRIRPWEHAPAFVQSQERRAAEATPKEATPPKRKRPPRRERS
jgi:predicted transcriptional regulator